MERVAGIGPALFDVWGATLGMATFTDIDKRFSTACVRIYWEISIELIFDLSGTLTLDGTQGLLLSIQNNTVSRNVRAQAPPRLVLVPGVGM